MGGFFQNGYLLRFLILFPFREVVWSITKLRALTEHRPTSNIQSIPVCAVSEHR
jgi:hypothetical protein